MLNFRRKIWSSHYWATGTLPPLLTRLLRGRPGMAMENPEPGGRGALDIIYQQSCSDMFLIGGHVEETSTLNSSKKPYLYGPPTRETAKHGPCSEPLKEKPGLISPSYITVIERGWGMFFISSWVGFLFWVLAS